MPQLQRNRPLTEKPLMSRLEHKACIRGLKNEEHIEGILKYLCIHRKDRTLIKECCLIEDALDEMFCHEKFGYIAEWIYRQWMNEQDPDLKPIQPSKVHIFPVHIPDVVEKNRYGKKSESLRLIHLKKLMKNKIRTNAREYIKEKILEKAAKDICHEPEDEESSISSGEDLPTVEEKKRGTKRKFADTTLVN